jgi:hypothetical protein
MVSRLAVTVVFMIVYGLAGLSACEAQPEGKEMSPNSLEFGLALLKDQPEDQFTQVEYGKIAPAIRAQAENYLAFYLTPEAQPQKDPQFKTRVFSATEQSQNDLIEYRWTFDGVPLRAVQSLNALKLDIPSARNASVEEVRRLVNSIVKLKGTDIAENEYTANLQWPNALSEGAHFSSNPNANIRSLPSWHDRIDAFVEGGRLSVLIYKKIPQLSGYQDGSKWFEKYPPKKPS